MPGKEAWVRWPPFITSLSKVPLLADEPLTTHKASETNLPAATVSAPVVPLEGKLRMGMPWLGIG